MIKAARYAELHAHSYFSLLDGASSPEAMVERAQTLGLAAIAITDHDSLAGAVRAWTAAKRSGLHLVFGVEITLAGGQHLTLLAESQQGYRNLCKLITAARLDHVPQDPAAPWPGKVQPALSWERLAAHSAGVIALSGCGNGPVAAPLLHDKPAAASIALGKLADIFGAERLFVELQHHWRPDDDWLMRELRRLARAHNLPVVATGNAHYAEQKNSLLRDALIAIGGNETLTEARRGGRLPPNNNCYLHPPVAMQRRFGELPQALANTLAIAERCQASLDFSARRFPPFPTPDGASEFSYLFHLAQAGVRQRYPDLAPPVVSQLAHELRIIDKAGLNAFFLLLLSLTNFARKQGIWFQIRGSLAGSLTAYALGISPIDPLKHGLLFERFLSEDRYTSPDADFDFDASRREEIIQHLYRFYGPEHVAMVANVVTYQARSALRDLGKALGFSTAVLDRLSRQLDTHSATSAAETMLAQIQQPAALAVAADERAGLDAPAHPFHLLADLLRAIDGCPRHLSIHSGGMLITADPLTDIAPLEPATMAQRIICQWNKTDVEDVGLVKLDVLGLRMLGVLSDTVASIEAIEGRTPQIDDPDFDDPNIYRMLQQGDAVGSFQTESRAQLQMAPRLKPRCFDDLVVQIAIVRPGPIQAGATNPYLRRRAGAERVAYLHPSLEPILAETLGVIIFQEQAIRIGATVAGFTPGQADMLRRTLSRSRPAEMEAMQARFLAGAARQGFEAGAAQDIWQMLRRFAGYGFPKSHVVAFALTAYRSAKLRYYYPAHFYCQMLNHQPMGFYAPGVLLGDARRHGVAVLPPDVNQSGWRYSLERSREKRLALRVGLCTLKEMGEQGWRRIEQARRQGVFAGLQDFCRRTRLPTDVIQSLIRGGAFDAFGERRQLLWMLGGIHYQVDGLDVQEAVVEYGTAALEPELQTLWDYQVMGYSPNTHLMAHYRPRLRQAGVLSTWEVKEARAGQRVRCAGMTAVIQRPPTAKGIAFVSLEDESGLVDGVVKPPIYDRFRDVLRSELLLLVTGVVQRSGGAVSLLIHEIHKLDAALP